MLLTVETRIPSSSNRILWSVATTARSLYCISGRFARKTAWICSSVSLVQASERPKGNANLHAFGKPFGELLEPVSYTLEERLVLRADVLAIPMNRLPIPPEKLAVRPVEQHVG